MSEYFSQDITWCSSDCANDRCFRNKQNIKCPSAWRSYSDFALYGCQDYEGKNETMEEDAKG